MLSKNDKTKEILKEKIKEFNIKGICFNSKKCEESFLFVAITGIKEDGHKYIENAIEKGASIIVYDEKVDLYNLKVKYNNVFFLGVKNTREVLSFIADFFYLSPTKKMKECVAVTGTNGKTTTTYLIKKILETADLKTALIGTIKNMIGEKVIKTNLTTPESLDMQKIFFDALNVNAEALVMEASSHAIDLHRCDNIDLSAVIFTNLTEDHLDYHKNMKEYLNAKLKLFSILKESQKENKIAILNIHTDYFEEIRNYIEKLNIKVVTFGFSEKADYKAVIKECTIKNMSFDFFIKGRFLETINMTMLGEFNVLNLLSALAYANEKNIDIKKSAKAIENIQVDGRFEIVTNKNHPFIVAVDYSHTPDSLINILKSARALNPKKLIVVFGCGGDRDRLKRPIMAKAAADYSDKAFLTLDNPRTEDINQIMEDIEEGFKNTDFKYEKIISRKEAIEAAVDEAQEKDIVIIAGKGHEPYQIFKDKTIHFDDREVAREALLKRFS